MSANRLNIKSFLSTILFWQFALMAFAQQVEVKDQFFFLDGQKFFIKGIGYEVSALPGEVPWEKTFNPDQLHFDIQRILSAGYNTIRTWAPFTEEELILLDQYDIKIMMGIWIDPHADFSDPLFVQQAKLIVFNVLSYSKKFDQIIAYLIMNEPTPETIFSSGYDQTVNLWNELIAIIHSQHPGRPVSIANTPNGTYIQQEIFGFQAFNSYIYNPVTINFLHGYQEYARYLTQLGNMQIPLVITEYGLSVSSSGPGNWGYGGNSPGEQEEGVLHMYQSLVNGGASGSCVFIYSDGWWKGGDEFSHDDNPEEWFGLVEYFDLNDHAGQERPAWSAIKDYQSVIIAEPKSSGIYSNQVPIEIFPDSTIYKVEIFSDDTLIYQILPDDSWMVDSLGFNFSQMQDVVLDFYCYDQFDNLMKQEQRIILISPNPVTLPSIQISTNDNIFDDSWIYATYLVQHSPDFESEPILDYIFYPHVGFDYGQKFQTIMPAGPEASISKGSIINQNVDVITVGAAFNIHFNRFQKRIVNQKTFVREGLITSTKEVDSNFQLIKVAPNPTSDVAFLVSEKSRSTEFYDFEIYHSNGIRFGKEQNVRWSEPIDLSKYEDGLYILIIMDEEEFLSAIRVVKL